jgi:two-component system nitrogen regulation response regulator GlnG
MTVIRGYSWPGNVRELQSAIRQAVLDTTGPVLFPDALPATVKDAASGDGVPPTSALDDWHRYVRQRIDAGVENLYDEVLELVERRLITQVLQAVHGSQSDASEILGITRTTLRTKIRKLGLSIDRVVTDDAEEEEDSG